MQSEFYKTLTPLIAVEIAEQVLSGENATKEQQIDAWQYLHDNKFGYKLQGYFGRKLKALIDEGIIIE